jgi:hypothetical protein
MCARCWASRVTTPIEGNASGEASKRRSTSDTTAEASTGLVRRSLAIPERWKVPPTWIREIPRPSGRAEEPVASGAGKEDSRLP